MVTFDLKYNPGVTQWQGTGDWRGFLPHRAATFAVWSGTSGRKYRLSDFARVDPISTRLKTNRYSLYSLGLFKTMSQNVLKTDL